LKLKLVFFYTFGILTTKMTTKMYTKLASIEMMKYYQKWAEFGKIENRILVYYLFILYLSVLNMQ
jgi:hypothetical protein